MKISYGYDDIGIVPRVVSSVASRRNPDTTVPINNSRLNFPLVAAPMDTVCNGVMAYSLSRLGAVGIIHRFQSIESQVKELTLALNNIEDSPISHVGIAVGVDGNYVERLTKLIKTYQDVNKNNVTLWICFDTANGLTSLMGEAIEWFNGSGLRHPLKHFVVAGNVASREGYKYLALLGVDAVRVGIGSGAACTTGLVTGIGQGIATSVLESAQGREEFINAGSFNPPLIIADGGVKHSGDILKALALGADLVMVGSLLSGFDESPGKIKRLWWKPWVKYKEYRGMASHPVAELNNSLNNLNKSIVAEGVVEKVPYRGALAPALEQLIGGVKSGMSYLNGHSIARFRLAIARADTIVTLTPSAYREKTPFIQDNNL